MVCAAAGSSRLDRVQVCDASQQSHEVIKISTLLCLDDTDVEIRETELNVPSRFRMGVKIISSFTGGGCGLLKHHKGSSHRGIFHFNVPVHLSNSQKSPAFWSLSCLDSASSVGLFQERLHHKTGGLYGTQKGVQHVLRLYVNDVYAAEHRLLCVQSKRTEEES